ncbi:hypothetical protein PFDSM3638_01600 [Pyrococcus furiosus DSM 3638]|uniref:Uncharacterized protein n=3 Tax=Pyrococcus furiosus TaxID=2261 RepID=A0A5C0XNR8_PYRFU|nr:hypothetical protein [Pyrococcus furiosus]AAL80453.1 hypothetical protein PF0329 [Pyrococcus furiosus DSM 3638]AFN03118.1 hypothetical protein PFC_00725 [Pyrococcus furiosus COM1]QEK78045.1 hypothetical protein PFDSM3638_01600 [Pyrococcus furiosus DSM 3638]
MKRLVTVIALIWVLFIPYVEGSSYTGWIEVGESINYGDYSIRIVDISVDGNILVEVSRGNEVTYTTLKIGGSSEVLGIKVKVEKIFLSGTNLTYINATFEPVLVGGRVKVGKFTLSLVNVTLDSIKVQVGNKTYTSTTFEHEGYKVSLKPHPKIFSGEVKIGDNITYSSYKLTIESLNMSIVNNKTVSVVTLRYDDKTYEVKEDESKSIGPFIVKYNGFRCEMVNNLCDPRISLEVYLRGAEVSISYTPFTKIEMYEKKDYKIGEFLVRPVGISGDTAYFSIMNNCGDEIFFGKSFVRDNIIQGITYDGLTIGIVGSESDSSGKKAIVLYTYNQEEKPRYLAYLNVTIIPPEKLIQYKPSALKIKVINEGNSRVIGAFLTFFPGDGIKISGDSAFYIEKLEPGKEVEYSIEIVPLVNGTVNLGNAVIRAPIPYPLACGGLDVIEFSSNSPNAFVESFTPMLSIDVPKTVELGKPFNVTISLNKNVAGNITLILPEGIGVLYNGRLVGKEVILPPKNTTLTLVSLNPGFHKIKALLTIDSKEISQAEATFETTAREGEENYVTITKTETSMITLTETLTETTTLTQETITKTETKSEVRTVATTVTLTETQPPGMLPTIISWAVGVITGIMLILLIAWFNYRQQVSRTRRSRRRR